VSFYDDLILPRVINLAMRNREPHPYREGFIERARPSARDGDRFLSVFSVDPLACLHGQRM
jgi:hypothetical protein